MTTTTVAKAAASKYKLISIKQKQILYLNLEACSRQEIAASGYLLYIKLCEIQVEDTIDLLINLNTKANEFKLNDFSSLVNRLHSTKINKRAFIGINGYTMALARLLNSGTTERTRLFDSYKESVAYLAN